MSLTKRLPWVLVAASVCLATVFPSAADDAKKLHERMTQTACTRTELLAALRRSHVTVFGVEPSKNRLAMGWGQVAFENGEGRLTYNHNLGNIIRTSSDQAFYINRGDHRPYQAFETLDDGAAMYWTVLSRCSPALKMFDAGNPRYSAVWLKRCGYYEADVEDYTKGLTRLYRRAVTVVMKEEELEQQERRRQEDAQRDLADLVSSARAPDLDAGADR